LPRKPVKDLQKLKSFLLHGKNGSKVVSKGRVRSFESCGSSGIIEGNGSSAKSNETSDVKAGMEFNDGWTFEPELLSAAAGCHSGNM